MLSLPSYPDVYKRQTLWRIRHERIRDSDIYHFINELLRVNYSWIYYYRKSLFIAYYLYQLLQYRVIHFLGYQGIAKQTAK